MKTQLRKSRGEQRHGDVAWRLSTCAATSKIAATRLLELHSRKFNVTSTPLVTCERTGDWAAAIRRSAERSFGETISFAETRSPTECRGRLSERRTTTAGLPLLLEFTFGSAMDVCELLALHVRRFGDAPRIVVGSREVADYEPIVREAGATHFVMSVRDVRSCVAAYLRYRDDPRHVLLDEDRTLIDRIRASLPWRAVRERSETS
jgi:hypothetical protein